jgi:mono/diheme cytochrome c family protein
MKKYGFFILLVALAAFLISATLISKTSQSPEILPDDIKKIAEKSCLECHGADSQNEDALEHLDFTKLDKLKKVKKITTLREIVEVIEEDEMPPSKFLKRHPDRKLTEKERTTLMEWAKKESEALIGN